MNDLYAVIMDAFDNGASLRSAYAVASSPFDTQESAYQEALKFVNNSMRMFKCTEDENRKFTICEPSKNEIFLLMTVNGEWIPIMRYTVISVNPNAVTSYHKKIIEGSFKKGTAAQMAKSRKIKKINEYVASLTPTKITKEELDVIKAQPIKGET